MTTPQLTRTHGYWNLISPTGQPAGIFTSLTAATTHLAGMRHMIWRTPVDTCRYCSSELTSRPVGPHQKKPSPREPGACRECVARVDAGIPTPNHPNYDCTTCGTRVVTGYGRPDGTKPPGTTGRCNTCSQREDGPMWRALHQPMSTARAAHLAGRAARARGRASAAAPVLVVERTARGWEVRSPGGRRLATCDTEDHAELVARKLTERRQADAARAAGHAA